MQLIQAFLAAALVGRTAWALDLSGPAAEDRTIIGKRDQFIFNACPEINGRKPPQKCSECGGDSKKKGVCDKIRINGWQEPPRCQNPNGCGTYCKCIHDDKGDDDDDGDSGPVPFPVVPPGFPPVPPAVPNPLPPKDGKEVCEGDYTERKCKDCKAKSGWCTEGSDVGCPCKEDCPADDKQDKCSDKDCKGEDGKCTIGLHKDCKCKGDCPEEGKEPFCNSKDCEGKDEKCTKGEHKECKCQDVEEIEIDSHPGDSGWLDLQQKILSKIDSMPDPKPDDDKEEDKPENEPKCKAGGKGIDADPFSKARDDFCKDPSKKYSKDDFELALEKSDGDCPKDDCEKTVNKLFNKCGDYHLRPSYWDDKALDGKRGPLRGSGEVEGKCGKYTFKKDTPKSKFEKPGEDAENPWGKPWEVSCGEDDKKSDRFKVDESDLDDVMEEFCKIGKSLDPAKDSSSFYKAKKLDDGYLIVSGRPATGSDPVSFYKDESACDDFDKKISADDCKKALKKIYKECNPKGGDKTLTRGLWNYNCVGWMVDTTTQPPKKIME